MKTNSLRTVLGTLLLTAFVLTGSAAEKIRVIATIPDLADICRQVGGDLVNVESLATGAEDTHAIPMKPSFVSKLNRCDVLLHMGMDMEHAFLPGLLEAARNPRIQFGKANCIDTSTGLKPLEIPASLDRSLGEVHPRGNPHYNLDPEGGRLIANNICEGLGRCYPQHETAFRAGRDGFLAKLDAKLAEWRALAKPLAGVKFVSYHSHFPYLAARFGLQSAGTIELRPGVEPTAKHIRDLIERMKADGVKLVIREPQFSEKTPKQIAAQTGARLVTLPIMVGGVPEAKTYLDFVDHTVRTLVKAVQN